MKNSIIIIAILGIVSSVAFARLVGFDPKMTGNATPLPDAYGHAITALGFATNEFHCTAASFETTVVPPGGVWYFSFYNTNGALKTVEVSTNSAKVTDGKPVAIW
jgi:hypothetical protein